MTVDEVHKYLCTIFLVCGEPVLQSTMASFTSDLPKRRLSQLSVEGISVRLC